MPEPAAAQFTDLGTVAGYRPARWRTDHAHCSINEGRDHLLGRAVDVGQSSVTDGEFVA